MLDARQAAAIKKALSLGGGQLVKRVRYGRYTIASATRPGRVYTVTVSPQGHYRCDCEAGLAGNPCWHAAATYIAKVEAASKGRVTRPATTHEKGN